MIARTRDVREGWGVDLSYDGRNVVILAGCGRATPGLNNALTDRGWDVQPFHSFLAAEGEIRRIHPDLIVVGQSDEAGDLLPFIGRARRSSPDSVVLFLADLDDPPLVDRVLREGADDVVIPPHSSAAILFRWQITMYVRRRRMIESMGSGRRVALGRLTIDLATREVADGGRPFSLRGREFELLLRLMEAGGSAVSREDLLEEIWGTDRGTHTVLDTTVHRLRRKLEEEIGTPDLVATVRGIGYRLDAARLGSSPAAD